MSGLFCNHCFVRRQIDVVASSTEFLKMMILSRNLGIYAGLDISSQSCSLSRYPRQFGESVSIGIPGILFCILRKDGKAQSVVFRDYRGIDVCGVVKSG